MINTRTMMNTNAAAAQLERLLGLEQSYNTAINNTKSARRRADARVKIATHITRTKHEGDLDSIIASELTYVERERAIYANSKQMRDSLNASIEKLTAIQRLIGIVDDPLKYRFLAEHGHTLARNQDHAGLPMDEARQAINSELARIDNLRKANSDDETKRILDAQYTAMMAARTLYIKRQRMNLEITETVAPTAATSSMDSNAFQ